LTSLLWIVWYDYMKICEWLLGVEYDVYHNVMYFLLYLDVRNRMLLLNTYMLTDCAIVGEYIYVDWWWCCWWLHIYYVNGDDVVNCLCEHICIVVESYVYAYMTDGDRCLYPKCKTCVKSYIQYFCCIEGDDLEVIWYRMHLEESRTLHVFE